MVYISPGGFLINAKETLDLTAQSNSNAANWVQFSYGVEVPHWQNIWDGWVTEGKGFVDSSVSSVSAIGWHLRLPGEGNWWHSASLQVCWIGLWSVCWSGGSWHIQERLNSLRFPTCFYQKINMTVSKMEIDGNWWDSFGGALIKFAHTQR